MIDRFLEWLGSTSWSVALLESIWVWPLIESTHVLAVALFFGTVMMNDFRLMGWSFKSVPVSEITGRLLPWTRVGFAIMVVTGLLIFYSNPLRYYHNIFFRLKMILFVVAGLNAFLFHRGIHRRVLEWEREPTLPRQARVAGAVSFAAWCVIVIAGRLIAYNWFDCDIQPQPGWVNFLSACPVGGD